MSVSRKARRSPKRRSSMPELPPDLWNHILSTPLDKDEFGDACAVLAQYNRMGKELLTDDSAKKIARDLKLHTSPRALLNDFCRGWKHGSTPILRRPAPDDASNRAFVMGFTRSSRFALFYATPKLQNDPDVVLSAVQRDGFAFEYASPALKKNRDVVLSAVQTNGIALRFASPELRSDPDVIHAAVKRDGLALEYVPRGSRSYEVALTAVRQNGLALEHVPSELKDRKMVETAVRQNEHAGRYAPI